jgi:hypothetical protein
VRNASGSASIRSANAFSRQSTMKDSRSVIHREYPEMESAKSA